MMRRLPVFIIASLVSVPVFADMDPVLTRAQAKQLILNAKGGDEQAQYDLAMAYHDGQGGLKQSDKQAVKWFRKAAEQDEPRAEFNLGIAYYRGIGTAKDVTEAGKWFRKAAGHDIPEAEHVLAGYYDKGIGGFPKDKAEAYYWLSKARDGGISEAGSDLKALEEEMAPEEVEKGKQLLAERADH